MSMSSESSIQRRVIGFLFDLDGTLTETDSHHYDIWKELFESEIDLKIDQQWYKQHVSGCHNEEIARRFFPHMTQQQQDEFCWKKEEEFRKRAAHLLKPTNGLLSLIASLREHGADLNMDHERHTNPSESILVRACIVTNACKENVECMLTVLGIRDFFGSRIVLGDEMSALGLKGKPAPDIYRHAMKVLNVNAEDCIAFEDSPAGMSSCSSAKSGLCVGIISTQSEEALRKAGAHISVPDFTHIPFDKLLMLLDEQKAK